MRVWLVGLRRAGNSERCHSTCQRNKQWGLAVSGKRMFSLSVVLDSAQVSRVLGDLQVTVRVQRDTTIGVSETRRRRVVALITKRLVT